MLNIKLFRLSDDEFWIEIYRNAEMVCRREMHTASYLDVFENLTVLLKCNAECRDEISNSQNQA